MCSLRSTPNQQASMWALAVLLSAAVYADDEQRPIILALESSESSDARVDLKQSRADEATPKQEITAEEQNELESIFEDPAVQEALESYTDNPPEKSKGSTGSHLGNADETHSHTPDFIGVENPIGMTSGGNGFQMVNAVNRYIPNISVITDVALSYFTNESPLQTGGHDPGKTGFTLQQVELHIQDAVDPFFNYSTNIVFTLFGVEVEEGYLFTTRLPWGLQLRAGQFLHQMGRLNPTHPHSWSFVDQPLVNGTFFGSEGSRGLGLEASLLLPLPWFAEALYSFSQPSGSCCGTSFMTDGERSIRDVSEFIHTARLSNFFALDDSWSLLIGGNYQVGENGSGADNLSEIAGFDLYLRYRPVESSNRVHVALQHETFLRRQQRPGALLRDQGQYTSLEWKYDIQRMLGLRYETISPHEQDTDFQTDVQRTSLAWTYYPSHFSRLRFQGSHRRLNGNDDFGVVANIEVVIGSHGAHDF